MKKVWVVSADMGYGHQRAAYPLRDIAIRIINSNKDSNLTEKERLIWTSARSFYEFVSKLSDLPIIGRQLFNLYDSMQHIAPYYPFIDRSKPNLGSRILRRMVRKGFMKGIVQYVKDNPRPLVSTIFFPAIAADFHNLKDVYCVITDSDINRVWVSCNPKDSHIKYLIPAERTRARLLQYGVPEQNIILTGFPLPKELTGHNDIIARKALARRFPVLDPKEKFLKYHSSIIAKQLGHPLRKMDAPLRISFMIGGAGAQAKGAKILLSALEPYLKKKTMSLNIIVGTHLAIREEFIRIVGKMNVKDSVDIVYGINKKEYFDECSKALLRTDVIVSKPSEMIFYTALGMPLFMLTPIGDHERSNREYMIEIGAGLDIISLKSFPQRLMDFRKDGTLGRMAWNGYTTMLRTGTYEIERIVKNF
jgi:hypothetical protein